MLFPVIFSLYSEIIMQNLEGNPGIKVGGHNLNNLRHTDDTVLMPKNKEDLQRLLDIEDEIRKKGLELNLAIALNFPFSSLFIMFVMVLDLEVDGFFWFDYNNSKNYHSGNTLHETKQIVTTQLAL